MSLVEFVKGTNGTGNSLRGKKKRGLRKDMMCKANWVLVQMMILNWNCDREYDLSVVT